MQHFCQADLNNLMRWSSSWQLKFTACKCKVMHVGDAQGTKLYFMTKDGVSKHLEVTDEVRDLGIIVTNDLKPARQCVKQQREQCR